MDFGPLVPANNNQIIRDVHTAPNLEIGRPIGTTPSIPNFLPTNRRSANPFESC